MEWGMSCGAVGKESSQIRSRSSGGREGKKWKAFFEARVWERVRTMVGNCKSCEVKRKMNWRGEEVLMTGRDALKPTTTSQG